MVVLFPLGSDPYAKVCNILSVNKICLLFWRMMINLKPIVMNQYLEEESVSLSGWNKNHILGLAKLISDVFWSVNWRHNHRNGIWNDDPIYLVILSVYLLRDGRLWNWKPTVCLHQTRMRENGSSLDFSFILLSSPAVAENWVSQHIVCCTVHLQKRMPHTKFWSVETFCERQIHWTFALFHITALCVWRMWPSGFGHGLWHRVLVMDCDIRFWSRTVTLPVLLIVWERPLDLFTFEPNFRGGALHSEAPN